MQIWEHPVIFKFKDEWTLMGRKFQNDLALWEELQSSVLKLNLQNLSCSIYFLIRGRIKDDSEC